MSAKGVAVTRCAAWLSLLAGLVWAAFSIRALHELPRSAKKRGVELLRKFPAAALFPDDAYKVMAFVADSELPDTVFPVCLLFGGGLLLGIVPRRQKS